ncbi:MAG: LuxR C-terminal-related transcriptional regulator [Ottowia sp.]|uniref:helix-turn-helix transcriptional regulator n=1 Tax=Ottowia sp. TaxID=1898956 RepID=UPI003C76E5EA
MDIQFMPASPLPANVERSYDALLGALGSAQIEDCFFDATRQVAEVDRIYCFAQRSEEVAPTLFCAWSSSPYPADLIDRYRMLYHRHDPIHDVLPSIPESSCASITFRAEEVRHADYRQTCFERYSIRHRLSVVKRVGDAWLTLSVARRSRPFDSREVGELTMLGRLALPVFAQNDRLKPKTSGGNFSVAEMERRLEAAEKGFTMRERQVCARTIVGMSAEGAAIDLGISVASVLTYRQRGYRRANVSNAMQLATLILH